MKMASVQTVQFESNWTDQNPAVPVLGLVPFRDRPGLLDCTRRDDQKRDTVQAENIGLTTPAPVRGLGAEYQEGRTPPSANTRARAGAIPLPDLTADAGRRVPGHQGRTVDGRGIEPTGRMRRESASPALFACLSYSQPYSFGAAHDAENADRSRRSNPPRAGTQQPPRMDPLGWHHRAPGCLDAVSRSLNDRRPARGASYRREAAAP